MPRQYQGYTQLPETETESIASPQSQRTIVHLRNVATIPTARSFSRIDVLDSLMPLSRNPWSSTPTLISTSTKATLRSNSPILVDAAAATLLQLNGNNSNTNWNIKSFFFWDMKTSSAGLKERALEKATVLAQVTDLLRVSTNTLLSLTVG
ncbi:hypothetical protein BGZ89_003898 [Linnemannia elongata]|nr:hypothetical protein BGZ89_003898 [Linnemannia elongata]